MSTDMETAIRLGNGKAHSAFSKLANIWKSMTINVRTKLRLFESVVFSYAKRNWASVQSKLETARRRSPQMAAKDSEHSMERHDNQR